MFLSRKQILLVTILAHIIIPLILLFGFFLYGGESMADTLLYVLFAGSVVALLYKASFWEFTWFYGRYLLVLIFLIMAVLCIALKLSAAITFDVRNWMMDTIFLWLSVFCMMYLAGAFVASKKPKNFLELAFPFKEGSYIITDGGDGKISALMNYHNKSQVHKKGQANTSMRFATDIAKISKFGFTVENLLTEKNGDYQIFGETLYSPCEAKVFKIVNEMDDNVPFSQKFPYNVGNCVVLRKNNNYIVMGHLERNSITVKEGQSVKTGQILGVVGNSGLTPRPHLHMQVSQSNNGLYWEGEGVAIVFNKTIYPYKNKVIKVKG